MLTISVLLYIFLFVIVISIILTHNQIEDDSILLKAFHSNIKNKELMDISFGNYKKTHKNNNEHKENLIKEESNEILDDIFINIVKHLGYFLLQLISFGVLYRFSLYFSKRTSFYTENKGFFLVFHGFFLVFTCVYSNYLFYMKYLFGSSLIYMIFLFNLKLSFENTYFYIYNSSFSFSDLSNKQIDVLSPESLYSIKSITIFFSLVLSINCYTCLYVYKYYTYYLLFYVLSIKITYSLCNKLEFSIEHRNKVVSFSEIAFFLFGTINFLISNYSIHQFLVKNIRNLFIYNKIAYSQVSLLSYISSFSSKFNHDVYYNKELNASNYNSLYKMPDSFYVISDIFSFILISNLLKYIKINGLLLNNKEILHEVSEESETYIIHKDKTYQYDLDNDFTSNNENSRQVYMIFTKKSLSFSTENLLLLSIGAFYLYFSAFFSNYVSFILACHFIKLKISVISDLFKERTVRIVLSIYNLLQFYLIHKIISSNSADNKLFLIFGYYDETILVISKVIIKSVGVFYLVLNVFLNKEFLISEDEDEDSSVRTDKSWVCYLKARNDLFFCLTYYFFDYFINYIHLVLYIGYFSIEELWIIYIIYSLSIGIYLIRVSFIG